MSPSDEPTRRPARSSTEKRSHRMSEYEPNVPPQILSQAGDAAAAAATTDGYREHPDPEQNDLDVDPPVEEVPPPPYSAAQYGQIDIQEKGMDTGARVARDGRVDIKISSKNRKLASLLRHQLDLGQHDVSPPEPEIPEGLGYVSGLPPPPMNIVIHIVGSRGDVQPFIALGLVLRDKFNHRVRIATHPVFKDFVTENGLEFFSIGGDPAELMAFMVKNPGLMPGIEAIRSGDIGRRRKGIYEMINGCWRSCIEPGDGSGVPASDDMLERDSVDGMMMGDLNQKPFVADAIIANPPSFAHIHIAEKLGVPLHLMFTMPWSPTQSFPHPLANIVSSNADAAMTNFLSYILVDLLTWQGIGDVINRFREKTLRLEPLSVIWAPGNLHRLRIPWTYCWSPALIPKPGDWMSNIDISGFYFLNQATNYIPPPDLDEFLNAGPPPVYIGFGSIVVDDPNAMTKLIFEAVKKTGQRALVSKGWGGLSADEMGVPEGVFLLGNCPHDWLFKKVSCVVHHGGAGTTATGIAAGRPTVIVPFFGDQQFWGHMCYRAKAGPLPIPHKELTADNLAEAIKFALKPETLERAKEMSDKIKAEQGTDSGADSFHRHLNVSKLRCSVCPERVAVWRYKRSGLRLSALAATVLANEGLIEFGDLRLYRARDYVPDTGPPEPISGGTAALLGSIGSVTAGIADYPAEILKSFKKGSVKPQQPQPETSRDDGSPGPSRSASAATAEPKSAHESTISLPDVPELASPMESGLSYETSSTITRSDTVFSGDLHSENTSVTELPGTLSETNTNATGVDKDTGSGESSPSRAKSPSMSVTGKSASTISLEPDADPRSSRIPLTSRNSSYSRTPQSPERSQGFGRAGQITMDSMIGTARATGNIVAAGMKSPLDFTMSIAQGLHNAPKLIGDKTVRPPEKVTGFHSGLKAAGREFFYQSYDGVAGFVTQPYQGAKEEGFAGFSKGLIRGSFGLIIKPGAAMWGLPGYAMKGIYAEIVKNFGKSTANFIIAARTAQGYDDWKASSDSDREKIITKWKSDIMQAKASSKWWGTHWKIAEGNNRRFYDDDGQLLKGWKATRHLSFSDRRELERLRKEAKMKEKISKGKGPVLPPTSPSTESLNDLTEATGEDFEQAIRTAVQRTSTNDAEEDERIERAIRASVLEFQRTMSVRTTGRGVPQEDEPDEEDEDEAYNQAVAASIAEFQRSRPQTAVPDEGVIEATLESREDDENFTRALQASLEESRRSMSRQERHNSDTEDDEDYHKAIQASMSDPASRSRREEDEAYRRAIEESKHEHIASSPLHHSAATFAPFREPPPVYELPAELAGSPVQNSSRSRGITLPVRPRSIEGAEPRSQGRVRAPTEGSPTSTRPKSMAVAATSTQVPTATPAAPVEQAYNVEAADMEIATSSTPQTQATPVDTPTSDTEDHDLHKESVQDSSLETRNSVAYSAVSPMSTYDAPADEGTGISAISDMQPSVPDQLSATTSEQHRSQLEQNISADTSSEPRVSATQSLAPAILIHGPDSESEEAAAPEASPGVQISSEEPSTPAPVSVPIPEPTTAPPPPPPPPPPPAPPAYEASPAIKDTNDDSDGELQRILKASEEEHKTQNNDEEFLRALKASEEEAELERQRTQEAGPDAAIKDDDEELQRILKASEEEAKERELELERQRTEESIVLEYIKRQSLAEEEYRKRMQSGA